MAEFVRRARAQARLQGIRMVSEALRSTERVRASRRDDPGSGLLPDRSLDRIDRLLSELRGRLERQRRAVLNCVGAGDRARATGLLDRETHAALTLAGAYAREARERVVRDSRHERRG